MKRVALTTTCLVLLGTGVALAQEVDAEAFATRLEEAAASQGINFDYASAETSGESDVILRGVAFGEGQAPRDVTFEGVSGSTADGWTVERVPLEPIDQTQEGRRVEVTGAAVENLEIAAPDSEDADRPLFFERARLDDLTVSTGTDELFSSQNAVVTIERGEGGAVGTDFDVESFQANFEASEDPETRRVMTEVGYPTISGAISGAGEWDPVPGRLTLEPLSISVDEAGEFNLAYEILGYTPSFIAALQQIQMQMQSDPESAQNMGMAYLGLLSQLSLSSIEISFSDDSLTQNLLSYFASEADQTPEQYTQALEETAGAFAMVIEDEAFRQSLMDAVSQFLEDPQSLRIAIAPGSPIPATQIVAAAMGAPQTLPDILSLDVSANEGDGVSGSGGTGSSTGDASSSGQ